MEMLKRAIIQALEDRYNAQISEADATIKIYLENSVGIGEHPQHIDEVDKQLQKIAEAQEKLNELQAYKI
jgi:predicted transcriptional regulator